MNIRSVVAVALATAGVLSIQAKPKYIAYGWDVQAATPEDLLANVAKWDATPMDGCAVSIRVPDAAAPKGERTYKTLMNDPKWSWDEIAKFVPVLKELSTHPSMKESMISAFRAPKTRIAWDDDAGWGNVAHNLALMARLAKEGGLKGILVDPEDYPRTKQFYWLAADGDYDATVRKARQRGREVFGAVFREYPDITMFAFWFLSTDKHVYNSADPAQAMRETGSLWQAFADGIFDVITPGAIIVDGNEGTYRCEAKYCDYWQDAGRQNRQALAMLSPENRDKYRVHHRNAAAFFLDGYRVPPEHKWYFPPTDGLRVKTFAENLYQASAAADYVWFDGEWRCYVKWEYGGGRAPHIAARDTWDMALPGFWGAMRAVKDPLAYDWPSRTEVSRTKPREVKSPSSVLVKDVKPGEWYEVTAKTETPGAYVRVDWKKENGAKWAGRALSVLLTGGRAVFRVPDGVDAFAVIFNPGRSAATALFGETVVNRLEMFSEAQKEAGRTLNVLYLGDSLSDFDRGSNHVDRLQKALDKDGSARVRLFNFAVRGDYIERMMDRMDGKKVYGAERYDGIWDRAYDWAFVLLGHNDTRAYSDDGFAKPLMSCEQVKELYGRLVDLLREKGVKRIIVLSPTSPNFELTTSNAEKALARIAEGKSDKKRIARFGDPKLVEAFADTVKAVAAERNLEYLDVYTTMKSLPDKADYLRPTDGVHLTQKGHEWLAAREYEYLRRTVEK